MSAIIITDREFLRSVIRIEEFCADLDNLFKKGGISRSYAAQKEKMFVSSLPNKKAACMYYNLNHISQLEGVINMYWFSKHIKSKNKWQKRK